MNSATRHAIEKLITDYWISEADARVLRGLMVARAHGWQPIATAPKDGTRVLLSPTVSVSRPFIGWWANRQWKQEGGFVVPLPVPTHWMPLPEPPHAQVDTSRRCYNCGPGPLTEDRWLCSRCARLYCFLPSGQMIIRPKK